ncbi:PAS domain-containing protein [Kiloniella antarctica]|uniref:PAS domain-containing protein n=1 Tax=Kiloniella antarctica TaxID=1550907 RepID=A0ABW5BGN7_9PROT
MVGPTNTDIPFTQSEWNSKISKIYNYWLSIHPKSNELPRRQDFDPMDIVDLLPLVWMLDIHNDPLRYKFRLLGTALTPILGKEPTGQWLDEAFPDALNSGAYDDYHYVVRTQKALYRKGTPQYIVPEYKTIERLLMPLVDRDNNCQIILGLSVYT